MGKKAGTSTAACNAIATDPTASVALGLVDAKTAVAIDKACFTPPALAPTCYDGSVSRPNSGTGWVLLVKGATASTVNETYCESPSGAFTD